MSGGRVPRALPPLPDDPVVSAVIPARGETRTLPAAVRSALEQPPVAEVVIASADTATLRVAERLAADDPRVSVVVNEERGTSAGLNAAMAAARGQVLLRVDGHAELPPGYAATAVEVLAATGAANVGGRQVPVAESGFAAAVAAAMRSPLGAGGASYRTGGAAGEADTVYLGVFRREAIEEVGGFDPRFVRNQDAELNERLRAHGYTVWFDPRLAVVYRPRTTPGALAAQYFAYGRWRRATARRHRGSLRARQLAAPVLVLGLVALAVLSVALASPWPFAAGAAGYLAALVAAGLAAAGNPSAGLRVALALATMHVCWGVGFLAGPPRARRRDSHGTTP